MAEANKDNDDLRWLEISEELLAISKRASTCKTVKEIDDLIDSYRACLGDQLDRYGTLKAIFELRNACVENDKIKNT